MEDRFLVNTITDWSEPPRARHQVTLELSKRNKVVFVNANHFGFPRIRKREERENLTILYPTFPVNYKIRYRIPLINELYQIWLFKKLKNEYPGFQVINFDFSASLVHNYFSKVIYYCNDNFSRISKRINNYFIYKYHERCEEKVARQALFCIATSGILKEKLQNINPNSYEIPLGGPNMKEFGINVPVLGPRKGKIKLGLVGFIRDSNTSAEVLNDLLGTGKFEISLIGPVDEVLLSKIIHKDDLKLLGILIEKALYEALNSVDIAIAPYHFNKLDFGTTPNKLLVYLALGKPAVVTHLKAINKQRYDEGIVYFVDEKSDFVKTVQRAYHENSVELMRKRIAFAERNSWEQRINTFLSIYNDSLKERDKIPKTGVEIV